MTVSRRPRRIDTRCDYVEIASGAFHNLAITSEVRWRGQRRDAGSMNLKWNDGERKDKVAGNQGHE